MDTCDHCAQPFPSFVMAWRYPDQTYHLAGRLCEVCAELVRVRHARGLLVITEDQRVEAFLFPLAESR